MEPNNQPAESPQINNVIPDISTAVSPNVSAAPVESTNRQRFVQWLHVGTWVFIALPLFVTTAIFLAGGLLNTTISSIAWAIFNYGNYFLILGALFTGVILVSKIRDCIYGATWKTLVLPFLLTLCIGIGGMLWSWGNQNIGWNIREHAPIPGIASIESEGATHSYSNESVFTATNTPPVQDAVPESWKTFKDPGSGASIRFPESFNANDGVADFVSHTNDGYTLENSESFCDGVATSSSLIPDCTKTYGKFGISLRGYTVDKNLIDSWGTEVYAAREIIINGKNVWMVGLSGGTGSLISFYFNKKDSSIAVWFWEGDLVDEQAPNLLSKLGEQILSTLQVQ